MRRYDREITEQKEILAVMKRCQICRLAFNADPVPYIVPLNFGLEDRDGQILLWFHGALQGTKYDYMDQMAAFEMDTNQGYFYQEDEKSCTMLYESVIGSGTIRFVEGDEKRHGLAMIMGHAHWEQLPWDERVEKVTRVWCLQVESLRAKRRPVPKR